MVGRKAFNLEMVGPIPPGVALSPLIQSKINYHNQRRFEMISPKKRKYNSEYVRRRYIELRFRALDYKGGKCKECGYSRCPGSMDFHHRDPSMKEFIWSKLRKRSWENIKKELDKCDLLCCRCHREGHYDYEVAEEALKWLAERRAKPKWKVNIACICGKTVERTFKKQKYCSTGCSSKSQEKAKWPAAKKLLKMVNQTSKSAVARKLGVSDNAVIKRLRRNV